MQVNRDDNCIYNQYIDNMPDGLVFMESLPANGKNASDYIFLKANKAFENLIKVKQDKLIGKRITEISKDGKVAGFDFLFICSMISAAEENKNFEYHNLILKKWYRIQIYKSCTTCFFISFHNITEVKYRAEKINALYESSVKLHDTTFTDINYQWIAQELINLTGASFVLVNVFNKENMKTTTRGFAGLNENIIKTVRLLGHDVIGKVWDVKEEDLGVMRSQKLVRIGLLHEFNRNRIPPMVVNVVEKVIKLGDSFGIGITYNDEILGSFIIMMKSGDHIENPDLVELFVNQLGITLIRKRAEQSIKEIDRQYRTIFNGSQDAMFLVNVNNDSSFTYEMINKGYETDVGISAETVKGVAPRDIYGEIIGGQIENHYLSCIEARKSIAYEEEITFKGAKKFFHTLLSPIIIDNKVVQIVGSSRNITKLKNWENEIARERQFFKTTLHSIGDAVITTDTENRIVILNKAAEELTGWSQEEAKGKLLDEVMTIISETKQDVLGYFSGEGIKKQYTENKILVSRNGSKRVISSSKSFIKDEGANVLGEVIVFRDVTIEKQKEEEVRYLGYHDKLTGLYNRAFFEEALNRLDNEAYIPLGIIMGDSNGLKMVNDVFGHDEGDKLLKRIGVIFRTICGEDDIIARVGGDEFAVILPKTSPEKINYIVLSLKQLCSIAAEDPISPSIALGTSIKLHNNEDINRVYKQAEDRMYNNKLVESKSIRSSIISSLKKMLKERTHETEAHAQRLRELSLEMGKLMGLDGNELDELSLLAMLHDIGKIAIPDYILEKLSKLNEDEWKIMKSHSEIGYRIAVASPELVHIANLILSHHERWDGKGYPQMLKCEEIPLLSRIIAVVDAYDAMTSDRPYQAAIKREDAIKELERCSGTQFDPYIVKKFTEMVYKNVR